MLILLSVLYFVLFQDGQAVSGSTCHSPKVSICSECTGIGTNPKCNNDGIGPFCFRQHTYTLSGVTTVKGIAQESDCKANISRSSLINPDCKLLHPPAGTICYDCCVSCGLRDLRCNDADVIDSRHIPSFVHQATQVTSSVPLTHVHVVTTAAPTDQTHITSANRHEPICQSGNMRYGYNVVECDESHPFCMNDVFYDVGGMDRILDTSKRCVSLSECVGEWWFKSKTRQECMTGDLTHHSDGNILCHYCCLSDIAEPCNKGTRLTNNYNFEMLRTTAATGTDKSRATTSAFHVCPAGWRYHSNSCYLFSAENKTWSEAAIICQAFHSELAIVDNQDENNFLVHHAMHYQGSFVQHRLWLDATDRALEGHWIWAATLNHLSYTNWYPGQPDNEHSKEDCLALSGQSNFMWTDENCDSHNYFICELSMVHH